MAKTEKFRTLEEDILILRQEMQQGPLSIAEILLILSGKGRPLILMLFSLPFCLPIQMPGLSIFFGLIIALIGFRMLLGKGMWLPQWISSKSVAAHTLDKIIDNALWIIRKMKPWIHPRLIWICQSRAMEKMHGLMICILGLLLALPLPIPLSNLTAAWSTFLIALGILEDDGASVLAGYLISLLTIIFFIVMGIKAKEFLLA
jgi:hypothetical protein